MTFNDMAGNPHKPGGYGKYLEICKNLGSWNNFYFEGGTFHLRRMGFLCRKGGGFHKSCFYFAKKAKKFKVNKEVFKVSYRHITNFSY